jgi:beta-glucosidase-like glycosyl hydrolase
MHAARFLVPRLEGDHIEDRFEDYLRLVRRGVAGFIVFGGEVQHLREAIARLQAEAPLPLIVASDLEQGLGQQVRGGTLFPPAMALARAREGLLRAAFEQMAREAAYAGINTILAPVLDVNTNPRNPIIATRAFGSDPREVARLGRLMIESFKAVGIRSCGKHFPGHGSTGLDSHITLPSVQKSLSELESCDLIPFREAVRAGVDLVMPGHLRVPAIEPSGAPCTLSQRAVDYLRKSMGFSGLIVTDALNMGGLGGYGEGEAALLALRAGVDVLLHPRDPEALIHSLSEAAISPSRGDRLVRFRRDLPRAPSAERPSFDPALSERLAREAIRVEGSLPALRKPFLIILSDDDENPAHELLAGLSGSLSGYLTLQGSEHIDFDRLDPGKETVVAVFSPVRAWKGGPAPWVRTCLASLADRARVFISFGSPSLLEQAGASGCRIHAYWPSPAAQQEVARLLLTRGD